MASDEAKTPKSKEKDADKKEETGPMAPASLVFSEFGRSSKVKFYRTVGISFSLLSGLVYPVMAFLFAKSFEDLSAPTEGNDDYMKNIRTMVFQFLYLGYERLMKSNSFFGFSNFLNRISQIPF